MKLSSLLIGASFALVVAAVLMLILGVHFRAPLPVQGAALYDPAKEVLVEGVVTESLDFACPVSEGEIGTHLIVKTAKGLVQVHLAPARILRSQKIAYHAGETISVVGASVPMIGGHDVIAREITRNNETNLLRDPKGNLLLTQY